jgi:hypothetical protein
MQLGRQEGPAPGRHGGPRPPAVAPHDEKDALDVTVCVPPDSAGGEAALAPPAEPRTGLLRVVW